jgi:hypothetical protein
MATVRSRTEFTDAEIIMKAAKVSLGGLKRGEIYLDAANVGGFANLQLLGNICSLPVYRKESLADGKYQYYDDAATPNLLASN